MTFTYTPFAGDRDRVRFHIGDTNANAPIYQDSEIDALIDEMGSWQGAVIAALESLIARLSVPNFTADWLRIDHESARKGYERLISLKRDQFGLTVFSVEAVQVDRVDDDDFNEMERVPL